MSYLLRCPECTTPVGLKANDVVTCKCGAKIESVGEPEQAMPPCASGVPGSWWVKWDGTLAHAALEAQAKYEADNAKTTQKLIAAKDAIVERQRKDAYASPVPEKSVPFAVPEKKP